MNQHVDVFDLYTTFFESRKQTELSLRDYLTLCRETPTTFANAAERMIAAIGEPEVIDTSTDQRLGRIFMNRSIKRYPTFSDFYGMEETIERIVGFFKHAAQGLEERKQTCGASTSRCAASIRTTSSATATIWARPRRRR